MSDSWICWKPRTDEPSNPKPSVKVLGQLVGRGREMLRHPREVAEAQVDDLHRFVLQEAEHVRRRPLWHRLWSLRSGRDRHGGLHLDCWPADPRHPRGCPPCWQRALRASGTRRGSRSLWPTRAPSPADPGPHVHPVFTIGKLRGNPPLPRWARCQKGRPDAVRTSTDDRRGADRSGGRVGLDGGTVPSGPQGIRTTQKRSNA